MNLAMQGVSYVVDLRGGGDIGDNTRPNCEKTQVIGSQLEIMVSMVSSTRCHENTRGHHFCGKCGDKRDMDVLMGTRSVMLDSRPFHEHTAFLERLRQSKRTPRSIMDSRNLAAYKARANWYNAGSEAGSIVWHMRHNPGGDPTYNAQQTVLNDLLAFIRLMPHYVFASRFQYLVVDKSRVQGRVVEDTEVAGCYVHYLSFRVVEIYFEHAQFGNDIHHKYLKRCMPLHVNALYAELDATLQRALEPTVHTATACTLLTTTYAHTTIAPSTTTNPPITALTTAPSFASSSEAHPPMCSDVTRRQKNTTMVQHSGMLSSTSDPFAPIEFWQSLPELPFAFCALCNGRTVGGKFCSTCGHPKGQKLKFENERHVGLACRRLGDIYQQEGPNPRLDGELLRTLMNTSKSGQAVQKSTMLNKLRGYQQQHGIATPVQDTFNFCENGIEVLRAYDTFLQTQCDEQQHHHVRTTAVTRDDDENKKVHALK